MMSLSSVHGTLSSLKTCQTDVGIGMDTVTNVTLDLIEAQGKITCTSCLVFAVMVGSRLQKLRSAVVFVVLSGLFNTQ